MRRTAFRISISVVGGQGNTSFFSFTRSFVDCRPSRVAESTAGSNGDVIDVEGFSGPLVSVSVLRWLTTFTSSAYAVVRVVELEEITGSILGTHFADQIDELRV